MNADDERSDYSHLFSESPPAEVGDEARRAFHASGAGELIPLTFDSLVNGDDTAASYRLTFGNSQLSVDAFISKVGDRSDIAVQTKIPSPATIRMDRWGDDRPLLGRPDGNGLCFESVPSGSVRLSFEDGEGHPIAHTDWFRV